MSIEGSAKGKKGKKKQEIEVVEEIDDFRSSAGEYVNVEVVNPYDIQFYEASAYSSSLGGAIVAMRDYSIDNVLSYSYGTWTYAGTDRKHLAIFADRGSLLKEKKNRFSSPAAIILTRKPMEKIEGDEIFSTIINKKEIEEHRYSDKLAYDDNYLVIGEDGDEDRRLAEDIIDLKVIGGGKGTEIHFYYRGERVSLSTKSADVNIYYEEGFVVDQDGRAVPFFENARYANNDKIVARTRAGAVYNISSKDVEFRLQISDLIVTTQY